MYSQPHVCWAVLRRGPAVVLGGVNTLLSPLFTNLTHLTSTTPLLTNLTHLTSTTPLLTA